MRFEKNERAEYYSLCREESGKSLLEDTESTDYIEVPDSYEGLPVKRIEEKAFSAYSGLESVVIGANVDYISPFAFANCDKLREIQVSASNQTYKSVDGILYKKDGKTLVSYPCKRTEESFYMPDYVSSIAPYAFGDNENLKEISISHTAADIGEKAFYGCAALESIALPRSIVSVGDNAFSQCKKLNSAVINGIKVCGKCVFEGCSSLEAVTFTENAAVVGENMFSGCTALKQAIIKAKVIQKNAFDSCTDLRLLVLNAGVVKIEEWAFHNCTSLESVVIPSTVKIIGEHAFCSCKSAKFFVCALKKPSGWSNLWNSSDREVSWSVDCFYADLEKACIRESMHLYENGVCRNCGKKMPITNGLTYRALGDGTYQVRGKKLFSSNDITIPVVRRGKTVSSVGYLAFNGCNLKYLAVPKSVSLEDSAVYGIPLLTVYREEGDMRSWGGALKSYKNNFVTLGTKVASIPAFVEVKQGSLVTKKYKSPIPGLVTRVNFKVGDRIRKTEVVAIIETMKMENELLAKEDGVITAIYVTNGTDVLQGEVLFEYQ